MTKIEVKYHLVPPPGYLPNRKKETIDPDLSNIYSMKEFIKTMKKSLNTSRPEWVVFDETPCIDDPEFVKRLVAEYSGYEENLIDILHGIASKEQIDDAVRKFKAHYGLGRSLDDVLPEILNYIGLRDHAARCGYTEKEIKESIRRYA